ncbi:metallophosphoesterase [Aurantimonas sp. VKM B-3413]|uniref:metallophosphoesterase n=1 Tax=Aurantimonas sp. VKM B-3413 TaxID=2779401 RepID=UPI001E3FEAEF|nr:metallophosphoesterase [Aurantimonas sp. VKM B-3413]MCB8840239.1 metallophosphoesterase [Aurantimonas sp. VKM B-3413]
MTRIHILSDIHDDICKAAIKHEFEIDDVGADVLVVAGDIDGRLSTSGRLLLERTRRRLGIPIVAVAGNHDYWKGSVDREIARTRERLQDDGIHILDCDTVVIGGVRFVGASLWTDYNVTGEGYLARLECRKRMNDFKYMTHGVRNVRSKATPEYLATVHARHRGYIERNLAVPFAGPTVVVTHHAPSPRSLQHGEVRETVDAAYASDLEDVMLRGRPDLWVHGHVHTAHDYTIGSTRVVSNPRGYTIRMDQRYGGGLEVEKSGFDPRKTIDLPTPAPRETATADPMKAFRQIGDDVARSRPATEYPREGIEVLRGMEPTRRRPK